MIGVGSFYRVHCPLFVANENMWHTNKRGILYALVRLYTDEFVHIQTSQ